MRIGTRSTAYRLGPETESVQKSSISPKIFDEASENESVS